MPPRRSSRVAAAAEQRAWAFPQLPLPLVLHIFSLLPADRRLRCAEVCRAWRATVALPALWRRLDVSRASGVARPTRGFLLAALRRAGNALTSLDVSEAGLDQADLAVALRASSALVEAHLGNTYNAGLDFVTTLLADSPQLRELHTGVWWLDPAVVVHLVQLLEGRPPYASLRLLSLLYTGHAGSASRLRPPSCCPSLTHARSPTWRACRCSW